MEVRSRGWLLSWVLLLMLALQSMLVLGDKVASKPKSPSSTSVNKNSAIIEGKRPSGKKRGSPMLSLFFEGDSEEDSGEDLASACSCNCYAGAEMEHQTKMYICFFAIFGFILLLVTVAVGHFTWLKQLRRNLEKEWRKEVRQLRRQSVNPKPLGRSKSVVVELESVRKVWQGEGIPREDSTCVLHTPVSVFNGPTAVSSNFSDWESSCEKHMCMSPDRHSILCSKNGKVPSLTEPIHGGGGGLVYGTGGCFGEDGLPSSEDFEEEMKDSDFNVGSKGDEVCSTYSMFPVMERGRSQSISLAEGMRPLHHVQITMPEMQQPRPHAATGRPRRNSSAPAFFDMSKLDVM